ncbi:unnamed protein product [Phytophthora lilii]|uniref:Unnamed protein product n=1 Tax=Phytophthora lilii TaxID=2077276 RepID=A0A9W6U2Z9_9STRA|nr:unnamed protein product [Phytophthora lilii]
MTKYAALVGRGASHYDGDIRNDTFRTFRGDPEFAQRVPEEKLVRLLNVFINELGSNPGKEEQEEGEHARGGNLPSIRYVVIFDDFILHDFVVVSHFGLSRYVQGMNVLCAPLLYVLPEPDAYHTFCQLIVRHCPHYMAPQLKGVEKGCALVDKCLQTLYVFTFAYHFEYREANSNSVDTAAIQGYGFDEGSQPSMRATSTVRPTHFGGSTVASPSSRRPSVRNRQTSIRKPGCTNEPAISPKNYFSHRDPDSEATGAASSWLGYHSSLFGKWKRRHRHPFGQIRSWCGVVFIGRVRREDVVQQHAAGMVQQVARDHEVHEPEVAGDHEPGLHEQRDDQDVHRVPKVDIARQPKVSICKSLEANSISYQRENHWCPQTLTYSLEPPSSAAPTTHE